MPLTLSFLIYVQPQQLFFPPCLCPFSTSEAGSLKLARRARDHIAVCLIAPTGNLSVIRIRRWKKKPSQQLEPGDSAGFALPTRRCETNLASSCDRALLRQCGGVAGRLGATLTHNGEDRLIGSRWSHTNRRVRTRERRRDGRTRLSSQKGLWGNGEKQEVTLVVRVHLTKSSQFGRWSSGDVQWFLCGFLAVHWWFVRGSFGSK